MLLLGKGSGSRELGVWMGCGGCLALGVGCEARVVVGSCSSSESSGRRVMRLRRVVIVSEELGE